jgi:hypothetical protein
MNKQAWVDISSSKPGASVNAGACALERALSLLAEFDRSDRSRCPTLAQLVAEDEGEQGPDYDHVGFDLYFGDKASASPEHSEIYIQVILLRPSGYNILLTVPRFWFGIIRHPIYSFAQYETTGVATTREQLATVIQAFFERPNKDLFQWVQEQPGLNGWNNK